jgi:hypothetical protein
MDMRVDGPREDELVADIYVGLTRKDLLDLDDLPAVDGDAAFLELVLVENIALYDKLVGRAAPSRR